MTEESFANALVGRTRWVVGGFGSGKFVEKMYLDTNLRKRATQNVKRSLASSPKSPVRKDSIALQRNLRAALSGSKPIRK
jgi:hypothetical protein